MVRSFARKSKRRTHWAVVGSNPEKELRQLPNPAYVCQPQKGACPITRRHGHVDSGLLNQRGQMSEPTNTLTLDSLNDEFWDSATNDNGGFQDAATRAHSWCAWCSRCETTRHLTENRLLGYVSLVLTLRPTATANRSRSMLRLFTPVRCFSTRHSAPGCIGRSCRRYSRQRRGVRPLRRFARHGWAGATRDPLPMHERAWR